MWTGMFPVRHGAPDVRRRHRRCVFLDWWCWFGLYLLVRLQQGEFYHERGKRLLANLRAYLEAANYHLSARVGPRGRWHNCRSIATYHTVLHFVWSRVSHNRNNLVYTSVSRLQLLYLLEYKSSWVWDTTICSCAI